jgi:hypothetical protein
MGRNGQIAVIVLTIDELQEWEGMIRRYEINRLNWLTLHSRRTVS